MVVIDLTDLFKSHEQDVYRLSDAGKLSAPVGSMVGFSNYMSVRSDFCYRTKAMEHPALRSKDR